MPPKNKFEQGTQLGLTITTMQNITYTYLCLLSRRGVVMDKPTVIADYNQYMLGVDKLDQLMAYYSFLHKSVKWWRKIFGSWR